MKNVVVVDYGAGNIKSVQRGLEEVGASVSVSSDPELIANADRLILPGVGAFEDVPEPAIASAEGTLWAGMVVPLLPIPVRGVVWYQGEANSASAHANKYKCQLQALINDWRTKFATLPSKNLTWVTVQLAPAGDSSGGALRLAQQAATSLPGVGLAVTVDLYDKASPCGAVHIRNKSAVASRRRGHSHRLGAHGPGR